MKDIITDNVKDLADDWGLSVKSQGEILEEAGEIIVEEYGNSPDYIKSNFDELINETEDMAHDLYLEYEQEYGAKVLNKFIDTLVQQGMIDELDDVGPVLGRHFKALDRFFLSMSQSRKARAGKTFEDIHNSLFKALDYPFDEQQEINGTPDFVMPSAEHFERDPMDAIVFTAKRTIRERWRQIVTEGARGLGFYLATIDEDVSSNQLKEMHEDRIYLVCPKSIKEESYPETVNVLSFEHFFMNELDPAMRKWERKDII